MFKQLSIPGVILVKPRVFTDARGFFMETYKQSVYAQHGIKDVFVQDNHSFSSRGTLRGLHFQAAPFAQAKLVSVIAGEILDVAVDVRHGSPTFGQWVSAVLSDENHHQLYVPAGFAHGFLVRSERAHVTYKVSAEYHQAADRGIVWNDPDIGVNWGIHDPLLSEKDAQQPRLKDIHSSFEYHASTQGVSS